MFIFYMAKTQLYKMGRVNWKQGMSIRAAVTSLYKFGAPAERDNEYGEHNMAYRPRQGGSSWVWLRPRSRTACLVGSRRGTLACCAHPHHAYLPLQAI